jgi:hypothetical protein
VICTEVVEAIGGPGVEGVRLVGGEEVASTAIPVIDGTSSTMVRRLE